MKSYLADMTDALRKGDARATVLVVDDEPRNRALMRAVLEPAYRVIEAANGQDALGLLEREWVDAVLLDVLMPGMSGYEVCAEVKRRYRGELLPVVLLTALADQESRNEGLQAGADEFLTKPIDRRELVLRVNGMVRLRRQQEQIQLQLRELTALQDLKDDLFALIVHDLRNPLASLVALHDLMRQGLALAPEETRQDLSLAEDCVHRMRQLLDGVLQASELEQKTMSVEAAPCQLADLVRACVSLAEPAARLAGVAIRVRVEGSDRADVDRRLMLRALENLLANAVKHSRSGQDVDVLVVGDENDVSIHVADRGPGVPDAMKPLIFDKFRTAEPKDTATRRGFGLGLYLVRLVMRAHHGSVVVGDRGGGGSVFSVHLPTHRLIVAQAEA